MIKSLDKQKTQALYKEKIKTDTKFLRRSQLLLLGKFEYGGGPIFKVVLEC